MHAVLNQQASLLLASYLQPMSLSPQTQHAWGPTVHRVRSAAGRCFAYAHPHWVVTCTCFIQISIIDAAKWEPLAHLNIHMYLKNNMVRTSISRTEASAKYISLEFYWCRKQFDHISKLELIIPPDWNAFLFYLIQYISSSQYWLEMQVHIHKEQAWFKGSM